MLPEPIAITARVTAVLEKLGVPYLIGGSLASTVHGLVRTTQDSDILTELGAEQLQPFVESLQDEFYIDPEMIAEAITRRASFNIIHRESMFKVDIFISRQRPFEKAQLARARRQMLSITPEIQAVVSSAEDTILAKLEWYRMGSEVSEQQWRDVLGVLKVQAGQLDMDYLHRWAKELKVEDLLQDAVKEAA